MKPSSTELSAACLFIRNGYVYDTKTNDGGCRITRIETISDGLIDTSKVGWTPAEPRLNGYKLCKGDILLSHINSLTHLGKCAIFSSDEEIFHGMNLLCLRVRDGWDPRFIFHFLRTSRARNHFHQRAKKAVAQCSLNAGDVGELEIPALPLPQQQKLADILGTWDEALEKLNALIAAKDRRKQALMQQLLTGQRRLLGFDESQGRVETTRHGTYPADWSRVRLGEITIESAARAANITEAVVLSCTKHRGLVPSEEYFGKRVYAADTSGYKVVRRGEFAYATNHIEEGSIGYQDVCDVGLVSPIYTVFRSRESVEDRYLFRLLKSSLLIHLYQMNTSASVDRRGSLRYEEFANIKVNLPAKPEQRAIADVLDACDAELRLLRDQRSALDEQKRGLMQQLLTGKTRVSV